MIKVYHGSTQVIQQPDVHKGRDNLDFGKAFYITRLKEQAENQIAILNQQIIDRHLRFVSFQILPTE